MCAATSINRPWSGQSETFGIIIKWAEEEIGKNSVIPWTTARVIICVIGKWKALFYELDYVYEIPN